MKIYIKILNLLIFLTNNELDHHVNPNLPWHWFNEVPMRYFFPCHLYLGLHSPSVEGGLAKTPPSNPCNIKIGIILLERWIIKSLNQQIKFHSVLQFIIYTEYMYLSNYYWSPIFKTDKFLLVTFFWLQ